MRTTILKLGTIMFLASFFTFNYTGQALSKNNIPDVAPSIREVFVDFDQENIVIIGEGFGGDGDILVNLGSFGSLPIISRDAGMIVTGFPFIGLPPGDYLLSILTDKESDTYNLTVGAVGPEGPPGPAGQGLLLAKTVFITSGVYTGDLLSEAKTAFNDCNVAQVDDGQKAADCICQESAEAAQLAGAYLAWIALTSESTAPDQTFTKYPGPYARLDGALVAISYADLTDGNIANPINVTENNTTISTQERAWTNVRPDGQLLSADPNQICLNWESPGPSTLPEGGQEGFANATSGGWTERPGALPFPCEVEHRLYCFEQ